MFLYDTKELPGDVLVRYSCPLDHPCILSKLMKKPVQATRSPNQGNFSATIPVKISRLKQHFFSHLNYFSL